MQKEDQKKMVEFVYLSGEKRRTNNSYGRNMPFMRYKVYMLMKGEKEMRRLEEVFSETERKELAYWKEKTRTLNMTCWGTSQEFEAKLDIGRWLGIRGEGKKKKDWPEFTRACEKIIKVL